MRHNIPEAETRRGGGCRSRDEQGQGRDVPKQDTTPPKIHPLVSQSPKGSTSAPPSPPPRPTPPAGD